MKSTRRKLLATTLAVGLLCLCACGAKDEPIDKPAGEQKQPPAAPGSDIALPVTAPMAAREHLLRNLDKHKAAARQREQQLDSIIDQNR